MLATRLHSVRHLGQRLVHSLSRRLLAATAPSATRLIVDTLAGLARSKGALIAENALLRQQRVVLQRGVKRVHCTPMDRALVVLLASRVRAWRQAVLIVQPETLLRWHRQGLRLLWRRTSRAVAPSTTPKVAPETIALIKEMAAANRLWGADRIRGELLKLNIRVVKTTVQRSMRQARPQRGAGQTWATFLRTHAADIWACDVLPVTDLLFRQVYAFFVVDLATRRVVHGDVTRHPSAVWVAQHLREATPFGQHPTSLIRDNDSTFGPAFARVAEDSGSEILRTAYRAPKMNALCERFLGSVRRECLDHLLILGEARLRRALRAYVSSFKTQRPHPGIAQRLPVPSQTAPTNQELYSWARRGPAGTRRPAPRVPSRRLISALEGSAVASGQHRPSNHPSGPAPPQAGLCCRAASPAAARPTAAPE